MHSHTLCIHIETGHIWFEYNVKGPIFIWVHSVLACHEKILQIHNFTVSHYPSPTSALQIKHRVVLETKMVARFIPYEMKNR